jgi:hypothetical protein
MQPLRFCVEISCISNGLMHDAVCFDAVISASISSVALFKSRDALSVSIVPCPSRHTTSFDALLSSCASFSHFVFPFYEVHRDGVYEIKTASLKRSQTFKKRKATSSVKKKDTEMEQTALPSSDQPKEKAAVSKKRDQSPVRDKKVTIVYRIRKKGSGWSVRGCTKIVSDKWKIDIDFYDMENRYSKPIPLKDLKKTLPPCQSAVFEMSFYAPSKIHLVVWVGMPKRPGNIDSIRCLMGKYFKGVQWPEEITKEAYAESQVY